MIPRNITPSSWRDFSLPAQGLLLLVLAATLFFLASVAAPWLLWAYNVERAGTLLEQGLAWPEPRTSDSLPALNDAQALEQVLGHLDAAIRWRPDHFHAYRLAAHVYIARGDWVRAAESLERARKREPLHPLLAWEAGLVYEHLAQVAAQAPREPLLPDLARGQILAPPQPLETPYCKPGRPESCYAGATTFVQRYARFSAEPEVAVPTLFLHAPAQVRYPITLPAGQPALFFLMGLDPLAREWGSDGATFQLWLEPPQGEALLLYEQGMDAQTARQGWLPGWADLSPWAGQAVTLVFGTAAGAAGDATADWYGWGDVTLTTVEGARDSALLPHVRMRQAWRAANLSPHHFYLRGDQALKANPDQEEAKLRWYLRAQAME